MKKITLIAFLLLSTFLNAQTTFAIYTEDPTIEAGVNSLRFSNGQGFALTQPTTAPYEGNENYLFAFNGTSSYFHGILFPRNAANTADAAVSLVPYSYYNLSLKTASATPFYIRMRGNNITAKVLIDPSANSYGFSNDNQWHLLSIPIVDFIPESDAFSLATITEIFVLRSNTTGTTAGSANDFEVDNIYASVEEVLGLKEEKLANFGMYPNPASNSLSFNSSETIDKIYIYSMLGQRIMEMSPKVSTLSTDISGLQTGVYIVTVEVDGKSSTTKLIKR
ncbi:hypothetical protein J2X31_003417 [Flavobacterium arsenatis]|uniref:Secretion system C-terminal sorting domain-containing protein n=1 Tax=Flavobacterium arsenatis TaxID=1484332 RepID=A0ABU1TU42_9FLAO|nr:T9SS type A sorting domain-containing protein [Flavobacterium arsenatis]MDR6969386.1 hypothetical protein [Flavobacterium arsenatis]